MLRKILIGVVALVLVLVIIIATRPATYRIERSTRIAAPPDVVFGLVNDFHAWDGWSPWAKLDPSM
ncbi:MAG: polyketide cyclase, partial [Myxococcaceae bacterium]